MGRDRGLPRGRALGIASTAMVVAGLVVLADVGVTLAWAEPISALYAKFQQDQAEDELARLSSQFGRSRSDPGDLRQNAARLERQVEPGGPVGKVRIPAAGVEEVVVAGTGTAALQAGPGHYGETALPGQRGTVAIAGHRTTYGAPFRHIDRIGEGDRIIVEMPYGRFVYGFTRSRIVDPDQVGVVRDTGHDRVVLTACHPLYSAEERYVVSARLVRVERA